MAKQLGVHKLHGKVDEQSYYYSKNGGYQSRKINPGMGSRVKNDAAFANTRLNNAEFGACGACAGALIRPITQRWRFILDSIATGKLVKAFKKAMEQDTSSAWGKRLIPVAQMPALQEVFNGFSKNEMFTEVATGLESQLIYDASTHKAMITNPINLASNTVEELKAKGVDGVISQVYAFVASAPEISSNGEDYKQPQTILALMSKLGNDVAFTGGNLNPIIKQDTETDCPAIQNAVTHLGGAFVILLPYRTVGGTKYTLQKECRAIWVPAEDGTIA